MGNITQLSVRSNLIAGKVGQLYSTKGPIDTDNLPHGSAAESQEWELEVTSDADDLYEFTVAGEPVSYAPASGDGVADIAEGLADAANANPIVRGMFEADDDGTDTVTLSTLLKRVEFDVVVTEGSLDATETEAPSEGGEIAPGVAVFADGSGGVTDEIPSASDVDDKFEGIAIFVYDEEQNELGGGTSTYPYHQDIYFLRTGPIFVDGGDDASRGDDVYLGVTGDDEGQWFTSNSADREQITDAQWKQANVIELKRGL